MPKFEKETVWSEVVASLKVSVSQAAYMSWIIQTHLISLKKQDKTRYIAQIGCDTAFVKQNMESRYFGLTQEALMKTIGEPCDITFIVKGKLESVKKQDIGLAPLFEQPEDNEQFMATIVRSGININFTFENFAVSDSNHMAHAAAQAVAESPGAAYNPLFIWGGVGVGKTHLMHAAGYKNIQTKNNPRVLACTGESFTNDIVEGIRNKTTQRVREKYRKLDMLLVDDIQFIAGKDTVQTEFFHTFNAVMSAGGQIIMTSDQSPTNISKLEDRLKSRFEAGLTTDIISPSFELRCAIIEIKSGQKKVNLDTEMVHLIAGNYESARAINGFLMKVSSQSTMDKIPIDVELVKSLIKKGEGKDIDFKKRVTPDEIIEKICSHYSIGKRALMGKGRSRPISYPRQILMYILRKDLGLPYEEVGRLVGGRDHTTVMHGVDKIANLAANNVDTREDIMRIKRQL